jgi:hypothetical protein
MKNNKDTIYADPLGDAVTALAAAFIVVMIGFLTLAHQHGGLPLWG